MVEFFSAATWGFVMWRLHVLPELLSSVFSGGAVSLLLQLAAQAEGRGCARTVSSSSSGAGRRRRIHCRNDRGGHSLAVLSPSRLLFVGE